MTAWAPFDMLPGWGPADLIIVSVTDAVLNERHKP